MEPREGSDEKGEGVKERIDEPAQVAKVREQVIRLPVDRLLPLIEIELDISELIQASGVHRWVHRPSARQRVVYGQGYELGRRLLSVLQETSFVLKLR